MLSKSGLCSNFFGENIHFWSLIGGGGYSDPSVFCLSICAQFWASVHNYVHGPCELIMNKYWIKSKHRQINKAKILEIISMQRSQMKKPDDIFGIFNLGRKWILNSKRSIKASDYNVFVVVKIIIIAWCIIALCTVRMWFNWFYSLHRLL